MRRPQPLEEDRELVAAEPRYEVMRRRGGSDATRDLDEHRVAFAVPETVVDKFEAVEIEKEHGRALPVFTVGERDFVAEPFEEVRPITQAGQVVVESSIGERRALGDRDALADDRLFERFAFRDVALHRDPVREVTTFVGDGDDAQLDPKRGAVFAIIDELDDDRFPAFERLREELARDERRHRPLQDARRLAHDVFERITRRPRERGVRVENARTREIERFRLRDQDGVVRVDDDRFEQPEPDFLHVEIHSCRRLRRGGLRFEALRDLGRKCHQDVFLRDAHPARLASRNAQQPDRSALALDARAREEIEAVADERCGGRDVTRAVCDVQRAPARLRRERGRNGKVSDGIRARFVPACVRALVVDDEHGMRSLKSARRDADEGCRRPTVREGLA